MAKKFSWKIFVICLVLVYLIAFIGSIFTSEKTNSSWYENIKPDITPPNYVFPIVWNILFFLIGVSLYTAWTNSKIKHKKKIALVFGINFFLNILWSIFYFGLENPKLAFAEITVLWFSILAMIFTTWKISRRASYLLIPYLLWVSFAIILNYLSAF